MPAKRLDVAALGEAMVEFNQTRPGRPVYRQGFGGDTSNCVIAAARAGARTGYLTRVGSDTFGEALRALWLRERVDTTGVETDSEAPTGIYFVTHGSEGHTFTYRRAGSAAARMTPEWLQRRAAGIVQNARWLHVSGISLAISGEASGISLGFTTSGMVDASLGVGLRARCRPLKGRQRLAVRFDAQQSWHS